MSSCTYSIVLSLLVLPSAALAQENAPSNSLTRALATFAAADSNKDGKLNAVELSVLPISRDDILAEDYDKDGAWSKDEFLVFYRQRLMLAGQKVGTDLETETARIQAMRKAKAADEAKVKSAEAERTAKTAQPAVQVQAPVEGAGARALVGSTAVADQPSSSLAAIEAGLETALENLEKRAVAGQATRADFKKVHDQLVARARAAASSKNPGDSSVAYGSEAYRKMLQSLDRLEKRAAEGDYSREDYEDFRDMIIHRARLIASKDAAEGKGGRNPTSAEVAAIDQGLQNALDGLEKRAAAGHATRDDFQRVRDQMIARARAANGADHSSGSGTQGSDTYQKMMAALDRLEKRAAEGGYSREEYQALRQMFVHRAREIQEAKAGEVAGLSDARRQPAPPKSNDTAPQPAQPQRTTGASEPARDSSLPPPAPSRGSKGADAKEAPKPQRPPPPSESNSHGDPKPEPQRPPPSTPPR